MQFVDISREFVHDSDVSEVLEMIWQAGCADPRTTLQAMSNYLLKVIWTHPTHLI